MEQGAKPLDGLAGFVDRITLFRLAGELAERPVDLFRAGLPDALGDRKSWHKTESHNFQRITKRLVTRRD
jgi:hypothetical protein